MRLIENVLVTAPREIDCARFIAKLELASPAYQRRQWTEESFHCSERIVGSLVLWCVRIDTRYFELCDRDSRAHADLVQACRDAINSTQA